MAQPPPESDELASSVTTAFLVALEQLAPTERAVFLLREVFELEFDEIATSVASPRRLTHCRDFLLARVVVSRDKLRVRIACRVPRS